MPHLLPIPRDPGFAPETGTPPAHRVITGAPGWQSWEMEQSGAASGGIWQVAPGAWHVVRDEWEFMAVLSGRSRLTQDGTGTVIEVTPGAAFVLRAGFRGIWEVIESTLVSWVLYDPPGGPPALAMEKETTMTKLLAIPAAPGFAPEPGAPRPERVIEGNPVNRSWDMDATPDGKVTCGVWEVEVGAWNVVKDSWEFMTIISGHSELTEDGGATVVLKPGDSAVMRPGFRGVWRVIEPTRKYWTIYEA